MNWGARQDSKAKLRAPMNRSLVTKKHAPVDLSTMLGRLDLARRMMFSPELMLEWTTPPLFDF